MNEMDFSYLAKVEGNFLVVGTTGCGNTTFVLNLGKNKIFGEIKEVVWVSKIPLSKDRENNIRDCFVDEEMDFKYRKNINEFDYLLEYFQREKAPCEENFLGENIKLDRFIIMDDVLGLADKSETFANFLTVSTKFGLTCLYVF